MQLGSCLGKPVNVLARLPIAQRRAALHVQRRVAKAARCHRWASVLLKRLVRWSVPPLPLGNPPLNRLKSISGGRPLRRRFAAMTSCNTLCMVIQ